jgi:hypothetical protein
VLDAELEGDLPADGVPEDGGAVPPVVFGEPGDGLDRVVDPGRALLDARRGRCVGAGDARECDGVHGVASFVAVHEGVPGVGGESGAGDEDEADGPVAACDDLLDGRDGGDVAECGERERGLVGGEGERGDVAADVEVDGVGLLVGVLEEERVGDEVALVAVGEGVAEVEPGPLVVGLGADPCEDGAPDAVPLWLDAEALEDVPGEGAVGAGVVEVEGPAGVVGDGLLEVLGVEAGWRTRGRRRRAGSGPRRWRCGRGGRGRRRRRRGGRRRRRSWR